MKKRFFALLTAVCIALTTGLTTGLTALADGGENSDMTIGMSTQEQCSCTTLCTEGNINPDCPVCGAEGADLTACSGAPLMMRAAPLAVGPNTVYVGGVALAGSSDSIVYATTNESGEVITEGATADNYNIKWDGSTLTLHDATIQKELYASDLPLSNIAGAAIGVINQSGDAGLTVQLEGNNKIEGVSTGIHVRSSGGNAALNITGNGTLVANSNYLTIQVTSIGGNAALSIENAKVTATSSYSNVVTVQSGNSENSSASLTVDGGSLTATAPSNNVSGIRFVFGSGGSGSGTPNLTVSGNATVRANGSAGGITNNSSTGVQYGTGGKETGGIIWNGTEGTVYGEVTLQEDLEIGEGESLTIPEGSSLNGNGKLTNNGTIIVEKGGNLTGEPGGNVVYGPTITTTTLPNGTVDTEYKQTLTATGNNITWSSDDLPEWLTLDNSTGVITGTPTTADTYNFTVTATNNAGSDSKEFTLTIGVAPVYSITAEPLKLDFGTLTEGYTPASQMVTITNNGNQPLTLTQPASTEHFEVGNLSKTELAVGEEATFTVQPKVGLAAGTYSEDIDVTASNNVTLSIPASLTVQKASVPTKPEVPSTGTTSGGSTGESTYPDVEDAQTSYEQATRDFWNRTINKIKKADEGDSLRIYIGIHKEIPGDVIQAIRENGVNVTFYNQDGDEVTVYAESAPTKYQAVWTLKQLGNYVLTEQQTPAAQEESPADQQPADEPTTPTQPAETEAVDTAKPNPSTGEGSGAVIAMIAAAAALAGLGATLRKR